MKFWDRMAKVDSNKIVGYNGTEFFVLSESGKMYTTTRTTCTCIAGPFRAQDGFDSNCTHCETVKRKGDIVTIESLMAK